MTILQKPVINDWYRDSTGGSMKVVAFDSDEGTVQVQLFEGEIEEFELDNWYQLGVVAIAPPEDWSGPFDNLVHDDFGDTEQPAHPVNWNGSADEMEMAD